jgi:apolipoprotein D and lipocalin family protein
MHTASATAIAKLAGIGAAAVVVAFGVATAAPPVKSVAQVDAQRWAGTWYELARVPNGLQARCIADATATYLPRADGSLRVIQRCRDADSRWYVATARAVSAANDRSGAARLRLSYLPDWLAWLPATSGDQWVVMLDHDYRYAVVSEPSRKQLWILSRTPDIDSVTYDRILSNLRRAHFPVEQLIPTPQLAQRQAPALASRLRLMV